MFDILLDKLMEKAYNALNYKASGLKCKMKNMIQCRGKTPKVQHASLIKPCAIPCSINIEIVPESQSQNFITQASQHISEKF